MAAAHVLAGQQVLQANGIRRALGGLLRTPLILDGRNLYNPQALQEAGIAYQGIGRRNALALHLVRQRAQNAATPAAAVAMA